MKTGRKKIAAAILGVSVLTAGVFPAAASAQETLKIATQYGLSYAPFTIMQEKGLIEKNYGKDLEVEWTTLNSGSAINEAFASGKLDVGAMGVGPAVTGIVSGVGYKIYDGISSMPNKLYTNDPKITSLADIQDTDKIALVNVGSVQHIFLAMACEEELGDAHALDNNLVAMAHPDGMTALLSGSVTLHLTSAPYTFMEDDNDEISLVYDCSKIWPQGNSFIIGLASETLAEENPELYDAVIKSTEEAMAFIEEEPEETAKILTEVNDVDQETIEDWLGRDGVEFSTEVGGIVKMATFMDENDFLSKEASAEFSDYVFDNVTGD